MLQNKNKQDMMTTAKQNKTKQKNKNKNNLETVKTNFNKTSVR